MRKQRRPAPSRTPCYVLSDGARNNLVHARDHLLLLARMSAACIQHNAEELDPPPEALVTIFQRLCDDVDRALRDMKFHVIRTSELV